MALTETISTGDVTLTGSVQELFDVGDGSTAKHFRTSILFDDFFSGNTVDISVYEYDNNENVYREWDTRQVSFSDVDPEGLSLFNFTRVSFWKFEDTLVDEEGTQNLTKTAGTETYVTGARTGKAVSLDNTTYYSASDTPYDFEHTDPFSIAFWVYDVGGANNDSIIAKSTTAFSSIGYAIYRGTDVTQRISFRLHDGTTVFAIDGTAGLLPLNTWTHVACIYAGNSNRSGLEIYINGILDVVGSDSAISSTILNNENLTLGAESDGGGIWSGRLDEVMVFSTKLTAEQVRMLAGSSPKSIYIPWLESTKYRVEVKRTSATYPSKIRWQRYEVT